jgi:hypothetical protein
LVCSHAAAQHETLKISQYGKYKTTLRNETRKLLI